MSIKAGFHIAIVFFLLWGLSSRAQQKIRLSLVRYAQSDGLPSYNIRQILKDKKGFLWIASQDGLTRFDGKTFAPSYTKHSEPSYRISAPDVRRLIEDAANNRLWVLPNNDFLDIINTADGNVVKHVAIPKNGTADWNITMAASSNKLWIGSFGGLKIADSRTWTFINPSKIQGQEKYPPGTFEVNCIAVDAFSNVWVCYTGYGIVIYNSKNLKPLAQIKLKDLRDHLGSGSIRVNDFTMVNNHEILFATTQGLRRVMFDQNYLLQVDNFPAKGRSDLNNASIDALSLIKPDEILIAGDGHLYRFNAALTSYAIYDESLTESESEWTSYVQSIYKEGNHIWLSCQQGVGLIRDENSPFERYYYDKNSGKRLDHLRSVYVLPNQDILCGMSSGLMHIDHVSNSFTLLDPLHLYHHIFQDVDKNIFLCRDDGIYLLKKNIIRPVTAAYPEFEQYKTIAINSHLFQADSVIVLGTENDNGILIWNYKKHYVKRIDVNSKPALASNSINNIYFDRSGRLWVLSDKIISLIDKSFTQSRFIDIHPEKNYRHDDLFFDMCECGGSYWIASYGNGIVQLNNKLGITKLLRPRDGLCNDGVYNIFNVGDSVLAITTNNGLSTYKIRTKQFKTYYREDGLHSNSFEEVTAAAFGQKIYAGGINGFTVIDPSKFYIDKQPPVVYFKNIGIKTDQGTTDHTNADPKEITIPGNWLQASISFVGIDYDAPKRVNYQYRIKEIDSSWINNRDRGTIDIIGLKPGAYTLEIKASNGDGYWSRPKSLDIVIQPKWFETWWFKLAIAVILALIINGVYYYRIRQLKIQQAIRRDIANDLHDDLGANLNSIKILTHLALDKKQQYNYLTELEHLVSTTVAGLRDMLWVLEDAQDNAAGLMERIRKFAEPIARAHHITLNCQVELEKAQLTISKTEKKNLFLIMKESVNNAFKHAQCQNIAITIRSTNANKVFVVIEDDGVGFNMSEKSEGYGLSNLRYRAEQIHYNLEMKSAPGKGTTILISKR